MDHQQDFKVISRLPQKYVEDFMKLAADIFKEYYSSGI